MSACMQGRSSAGLPRTSVSSSSNPMSSEVIRRAIKVLIHVPLFFACSQNLYTTLSG